MMFIFTNSGHVLSFAKRTPYGAISSHLFMQLSVCILVSIAFMTFSRAAHAASTYEIVSQVNKCLSNNDICWKQYYDKDAVIIKPDGFVTNVDYLEAAYAEHAKLGGHFLEIIHQLLTTSTLVHIGITNHSYVVAVSYETWAHVYHDGSIEQLNVITSRLIHSSPNKELIVYEQSGYAPANQIDQDTINYIWNYVASIINYLVCA